MASETRPANDTRQWDDHWARFAAATRLNPGQMFRRRLITRRLWEAGSGTVLDVGCGAGDLLAALRQAFPKAELAGIDQSGAGLEIARAGLLGAILAVHDFARVAEPPAGLAGWASHAVCSEVLEHLDHPAEALTNIRKLLKPGGELVVTVPGGPLSAFDRKIGHRAHYTARRLEGELVSAGFVVDMATGAGFPFFNLYRLVVIARGESLADDIDQAPSLLARTVMALFRGLLRITLPWPPWGWQIVAVARNPDPADLSAP